VQSPQKIITSAQPGLAESASVLEKIFYETLPPKVRVMEEKGAYSFIRSRRHALRYPWLDPNFGNVDWLIVDVDRDLGFYPKELVEDAILPEPNLIVRNPNNGHCQFFWLLADPIYAWSHQQQTRPYRYYLALWTYFTRRLGGDIGFSRGVAKNPFHPFWATLEIHDHAYSLSELNEYRIPIPQSKSFKSSTAKITRAAETTGEGRNCSLFDTLREWAYSRSWEAKSVDYDDWLDQVTTRAHALNGFSQPLPISEVRSVSRSVAKFVYYRYEPGSGQGGCKRGRDADLIHDEMTTADRQRLAAQQTNDKRKSATETKISKAVQALKAKGERVTVSAVARSSGIHRNTISRYYRGLLAS